MPLKTSGIGCVILARSSLSFVSTKYRWPYRPRAATRRNHDIDGRGQQCPMCSFFPFPPSLTHTCWEPLAPHCTESSKTLGPALRICLPNELSAYMVLGAGASIEATSTSKSRKLQSNGYLKMAPCDSPSKTGIETNLSGLLTQVWSLIHIYGNLLL